MTRFVYRKEFDEGMCSDLVDEDLNGAVKAFEGDENVSQHLLNKPICKYATHMEK